MSRDQTTLSIDKKVKKKAEQMAKKMHLSLAGVVRILLNDFADGKLKITTVMVAQQDENSFSLKDQKELDKALRDLEESQNLEGPFDSAEEFIASLKKH